MHRLICQRSKQEEEILVFWRAGVRDSLGSALGDTAPSSLGWLTAWCCQHVLSTIHLRELPCQKDLLKYNSALCIQELCHEELQRSLSTHLAGKEESRGKSLQVFLCFPPYWNSARSLLALLSWLCSQQTHPSHPHGSANMIKGTRGKMEMRSLVIPQFHYKKISLGRGHFYLSNSWDKFTSTRMISKTSYCSSSLFTQGFADPRNLIRHPHHPHVGEGSWECTEVTQALGACGCGWRHWAPWDQGLVAETLKEFFHLVYPWESATAATEPWSLRERDKV